jgi:hypothetical protein
MITAFEFKMSRQVGIETLGPILDVSSCSMVNLVPKEKLLASGTSDVSKPVSFEAF